MILLMTVVDLLLYNKEYCQKKPINVEHVMLSNVKRVLIWNHVFSFVYTWWELYKFPFGLSKIKHNIPMIKVKPYSPYGFINIGLRPNIIHPPSLIHLHV